MSEERIKVVYIVGAGRSGSTILGNVLGQIEGLFHVGEVHSLWDVCLPNDRPCGCGQPISTCNFWQSVLHKAFGTLEESDVRRMLQLRDKHLPRTHEVPMHVFWRDDLQQSEALQDYARHIERLYGAVQEISQCEWIVDSSKIPSYAYLLSTIPSIELYLIHLVRDARAVAYSWQRRAIEGFRPNIAKAMMTWNVRNVIAEVFGAVAPSPYVQLFYEDFASQPRRSTHRVLKQLGIAIRNQPFTSKRKVMLTPAHTAWGNPGRHRTGVISINLDRAWETEMIPRAKVGVTALTWPLLLRYDYLGVGSRAASKLD